VSIRDCPKCGLAQAGAEEGPRCGIVFARYRGGSSPRPSPSEKPRRPRPGALRVVRRAFSWGSLALSIVLLGMILVPSSPPRISVTPEAVQRARAKVQEFQQSVGQGYESRLEMDEPELNGWLGANLALKRPGAGPDSTPSTTPAEIPQAPEEQQDPTIEQVQSSVRDVKIELGDENLRAHVSFELHGKVMSLEMEGRLTVRDGCLRLEPTAGKLGSLPLPAATLESAASRLFDSPGNREKFRLPAEIQDVAVSHGHLVVTSRRSGR